MIERRLVHIEKCLLGGDTWATEGMSLTDRIKFFRDTGEWPGVHSKEATKMFMQGDIDGERTAGKDYCAEKKLARAREAGLEIR